VTLTIEQHPSLNHSPRHGTPISILVLHATAGSYESALAWLCNPRLDRPERRVSTHYLIRKDGHIAQLVPDARTAWHAGRSRWHGVMNINERSIGVELENANDGRDPYPPQQLASAHALCQSLIARYNIERADVVRHLDIAPGRKTDPAGLPWPAFADSLYLDSAPPAAERHYRVKRAVTAGATIRAAPRTNAAVLGRLRAGDAWAGLPETGQRVTIAGFGSSDVWICSGQFHCIWSGLLEEV
jgi:N-acetyl-anhydromuramyl-L-alanine amidase AmpD